MASPISPSTTGDVVGAETGSSTKPQTVSLESLRLAALRSRAKSRTPSSEAGNSVQNDRESLEHAADKSIISKRELKNEEKSDSSSKDITDKSSSNNSNGNDSIRNNASNDVYDSNSEKEEGELSEDDDYVPAPVSASFVWDKGERDAMNVAVTDPWYPHSTSGRKPPSGNSAIDESCTTLQHSSLLIGHICVLRQQCYCKGLYGIHPISLKISR
ncbi:hypothetical protein V1511DRAFT_107563 [Dipodascopsis uninucleata]